MAGSAVRVPVALLLALCGITFGTIYQKRHALELDLNIGLMIQNLVATSLLAPIALLHEHFRFDTSAAFTGSLLWMIFLNSGASFALFFMLLRLGLATRISTLFYLVTPITALLGWLLMHEPMSAIKVAGFARRGWCLPRHAQQPVIDLGALDQFAVRLHHAGTA